MVFCEKFQKELPGLDVQPWPGELGQRVYENISAEAWKLWEERMKMILNEYRLMPWQKEAQQLVTEAHGGILLRRRRGTSSRLRSGSRASNSFRGWLQPSACAIAILESIVNDRRACAARTAASASAAVAARAKMNPR